MQITLHYILWMQLLWLYLIFMQKDYRVVKNNMTSFCINIIQYLHTQMKIMRNRK